MTTKIIKILIKYVTRLTQKNLNIRAIYHRFIGDKKYFN